MLPLTEFLEPGCLIHVHLLSPLLVLVWHSLRLLRSFLWTLQPQVYDLPQRVSVVLHIYANASVLNCLIQIRNLDANPVYILPPRYVIPSLDLLLKLFD